MNKTVLICIVSLLIALPACSKAANKTSDVNNQLGVTYAENSIKKAESSIKSNNFSTARQNIDSVNQWVSDATEYHTDLFKTLKKLENADAQANIERDLAIKFATMRDKLLFLQAQVLIHDGLKRKAVENLVEVMKSQPNSDLGFQAYKILQDIGFTYSIESVPVKTEVIQP